MAALEIANEARAIQARSQGQQNVDRRAAARPSRVPTDREGVRHAARAPQGREGQSRQDHERVPRLVHQDLRRPQRPPTRRTRRAPEPVAATQSRTWAACAFGQSESLGTPAPRCSAHAKARADSRTCRSSLGGRLPRQSQRSRKRRLDRCRSPAFRAKQGRAPEPGDPRFRNLRGRDPRALHSLQAEYLRRPSRRRTHRWRRRCTDVATTGSIAPDRQGPAFPMARNSRQVACATSSRFAGA